MPIYEFRCGECGERFEALVSMGTERADCRLCGAAVAPRVLSPQAAPMSMVRSPGATRGQEARNAELRRRTKADFKAHRQRARDRARGGK